MSFSRRLTLAAAGAVAAAILVLSGLTYVIVRAELRGEVDDSLRQQAGRADQIGFRERGPRPAGPRPGFGPRPGRGAFAGPGPGPGGAGASPPPPPDELPGQVPDAPGGQLGGARGYVQIVTGTGRAARPPGAGTALPITSRTIAVANGDVKEFLNDATVDGTHLRILTMRGPIDGVALQIARPLTEVDSVL
ncbi:MAG: two-component system, OmpR family, sensor histidine kinase MprB, partial [Thermoleophilaceae bacterium]|nr:two-component system, OmpR family, sensor histidine kinase MprB [Thermoleophilaceae bacterium]